MDSNLPPDNNLPQVTPPPASPPPPPPAYHRPPPVIAPIAAPRPARRGFGWMIISIVLLVFLVFSLLINFSHIVPRKMGGRVSSLHSTVGPRLEEVTVREGSSGSKIVVIPIEGIITGQVMEQGGYSMVTVIKEQLKRAKNDSDVRAVLLRVDSPGGEVLASDEIAKAIRKFQNDSSKPVIVSMGSLAASGGYYVSAPCEWIVANELTITGSIGVIMHGFNYRGLLDKVGVRPQVFKSGKYKDMLSGTKEPEEITAEEQKMVQNMIDETFQKFKGVVQEGRDTAFRINNQRGKKLSQDWEDYADGRILSGTEAKRLGFVDELGDFETAIDRAKILAGIKSPELIQYQPVFDLSNLFRLFGKTDAKAIKVDLGMEIPKLTPGCMYFLSPTYVQ